MNDSLANHERTVNIGGKVITNLKLSDDIDSLTATR